MRLLVVTNLYPPQELGGYGRSIADFAWGLQQRGHQLQVLSNDAPYLGPGGATGPSGEPVARGLQLKGHYQGGVHPLTDPATRAAVDQANAALLRSWLARGWDGVLLGNLDLFGIELLPVLLEAGIPVLHHVGFVSPPFAPQQMPAAPHYRLLAASVAVRQGLVSAGLPVAQAPVVYPGARCELFGPAASGRLSPVASAAALAAAGHPWGSPANPLKLGFAGLLMGSKGAHTVVEALIALHRQGVALQASLAGDSFQAGYREQLEAMLAQAGLAGAVRFVGQLQRPQLARFWALQQVGVFASIHPEAFGIVGAEIMASGAALLTTGVGGAAELIEPGISGLRFEPGNAASLVEALQQLLADPALLQRLARAGEQRARAHFSVQTAAAQLENLFADAVVKAAGVQAGFQVRGEAPVVF
ncbi:MAG: glycosyltransferase family 4 protein [Cyanobacteriota bacterium]|nr:glycosyltransferase family 4 protein [Cyanobacteriota bacterium]